MHKCAYIMFVSPDKKRSTNCVNKSKDIALISLIKDKIRSLKTLCIFFFLFFFVVVLLIKPTIFLNVFSDFNKMAEKRKFSDGKTFGRPKFRTEKFSDKKKSESFSVRKFSFLMYIYFPTSIPASFVVTA